MIGQSFFQQRLLDASVVVDEMDLFESGFKIIKDSNLREWFQDRFSEGSKYLFSGNGRSCLIAKRDMGEDLVPARFYVSEKEAWCMMAYGSRQLRTRAYHQLDDGYLIEKAETFFREYKTDFLTKEHRDEFVLEKWYYGQDGLCRYYNRQVQKTNYQTHLLSSKIMTDKTWKCDEEDEERYVIYVSHDKTLCLQITSLPDGRKKEKYYILETKRILTREEFKKVLQEYIPDQANLYPKTLKKKEISKIA